MDKQQILQQVFGFNHFRQSHYRDNRPQEVRGASKRFRNILVKFYLKRNP